jgi:hypothetical protein
MSVPNIDEHIKTVNKLNNRFIDILENPFIKYGFLIFIVIRIMFIDRMEEWYLELFNYTSVKIIYALLVAYSACFDPVYAIALTTLIIICIQELYSRKAGKNIKNSSRPLISSGLSTPQLTLPTSAQLPTQRVGYQTVPDSAIMVNDANVYNLINKHTLQRVPDTNDKLIAEYDYYEDPAYRTLTANVQEKNYLGNNKFYVTESDLANIQTNEEPDVNQNISVQAFPKVMNIQGLPNGFDKGVGGYNPQLASVSK